MTDIRKGLNQTESDLIKHFLSKGRSESEAIDLARKMVRKRNIGNRIEKMSRHDPSKEAIAEANRREVARQKREAEESKNRAEIEDAKRRTGRLYFT